MAFPAGSSLGLLGARTNSRAGSIWFPTPMKRVIGQTQAIPRKLDWRRDWIALGSGIYAVISPNGAYRRSG